jgi:hypothetical protein
VDKPLVAHECAHAIEGLVRGHAEQDSFTGVIRLGDDWGLSLGTVDEIPVTLAGPCVQMLLQQKERATELAVAFLANPFVMLDVGRFLLKDQTDFTKATHLSDAERANLTPELRAMVYFHSSLVCCGFYSAIVDVIESQPDTRTVMLNTAAVKECLSSVYDNAKHMTSNPALFAHIEGIKALAASLVVEEPDDVIKASASASVMKVGDRLPPTVQNQLKQLMEGATPCT